MKNFLWIVALIIVIALLNTFVGGMSGQALAALFLAILVFWGKGDGWIAGYNTASEEEKAKVMLEHLYFYYSEHIELLPAKYLRMYDEGEDKGRVLCDYISGMTDQYAITKFSEYFLPEAWAVDGY